MYSKVFRVFLSSTFGDFQAEREALRQRVWPALERFCKVQGASFEAVDLRWGISEADALSQETLRICLDEIAHSQRLSPQPNFLMLLGDRYGWRPLPTEIPADEFEALLAQLGAQSQGHGLLCQWYRRDDNLQPAQCRLLPRIPDTAAGSSWPDVEAKLLGALRQAALGLGLTPERKARYFLSATHLEIIQGALAVEEADKHVVAVFRHIEGLPQTGDAARQFVDAPTALAPSDAASIQQLLREDISSKLSPERQFAYRCQWLGAPQAPISTLHLDALCADVERSLRALMEEELRVPAGDALAQEMQSHRLFAQASADAFMGRSAQLATQQHWLAQASQPE